MQFVEDSFRFRRFSVHKKSPCTTACDQKRASSNYLTDNYRWRVLFQKACQAVHCPEILL